MDIEIPKDEEIWLWIDAHPNRIFSDDNASTVDFNDRHAKSLDDVVNWLKSHGR